MTATGSVAQFRQGFREEARELVVELESVLLELNEQPSDADLVGRVFRALHTIKGSGAMFGFDELAAFVHNLENAFDEVRQGHLTVTAVLVDLTLSALDQIRAMVEEAEGSSAVDQEACAAILARLKTLLGKQPDAPGALPDGPGISGPARSGIGTPETGVAVEVRASGPNSHAPAQRPWHIRFAPGPEMMRYGADPLLLLRELAGLGSLQAEASLDALPPLAELEPERCYASWVIRLTTSAPADSIRDVFIFVEDSCELTIEAGDIEPAEEAPAVSAIAADERKNPAGNAPSSAEPICAADRVARGLEEKRPSAGRRGIDQADTSASLRVPAARLDQLVDLVGELVTVQARLSEIAARFEESDVTAVSEEIERLTSSLRENSMTLRMLPIRATFEKFRRLVHDLARDLGKNVELTIDGAETELDKTVIDQLGDPLMHLIRNSMDHGVETPDRRTAAGKKPAATIHLSARHSGASVLIGVSDDGAGIDAEAVRSRAVERGLTTPEAQLTDAQIFSFIFEPGFSTAKQITDISGRGVGMDVVRQRVESLRGSIEVSSGRGTGTTVTLRLPLTLAIIDGLLVRVGESFFVLPLASTLECIELTREEVQKADGKHIANVRGQIVPYIRLRQYFAVDTAVPEREQIMVVESEEGRCGLVVDEVLGDCQTVIRSLGRLYRHVQVVSGATILGNGTVALILDPLRLVQEAVRAKMQRERGRPHSPIRNQEDGRPADSGPVSRAEPDAGAWAAASHSL